MLYSSDLAYTFKIWLSWETWIIYTALAELRKFKFGIWLWLSSYIWNLVELRKLKFGMELWLSQDCWYLVHSSCLPSTFKIAKPRELKFGKQLSLSSGSWNLLCSSALACKRQIWVSWESLTLVQSSGWPKKAEIWNSSDWSEKAET